MRKTPEAAVEGKLIRQWLGTGGGKRSGLRHWRQLGFGCGESI